MMDAENLQQRVVSVVAAALDRNPSEIQPGHSLIDDLGAESIDFLDIRFRIETEFKIKVTDEELWEGTLYAEGTELISEQGITAEGMELLKRRMNDFRWERFPNGISKGDLPRLITTRTIVDYLKRRFEKETVAKKCSAEEL
ncbi:MAG TPA: phosphopantetheine-binding protein [Acidobacteriota bacterium]|jgi:acyl carrier protein